MYAVELQAQGVDFKTGPQGRERSNSNHLQDGARRPDDKVKGSDDA